MRYGMAINKEHCIGCQACTIACLSKHGNPPNTYYSKVQITEQGTFPEVTIEYLPVLCNHCTNSPCVQICPTEATYADENGIVVIDQKVCIGCGSCILACPYNARVLNEEAPGYFPDQDLTLYEETVFAQRTTGVASKCDFCKDFLEQGKDPACVNTCVGNARIFGDIEDPTSEVSLLIAENEATVLQPEQKTEPNVYYY